MNGLYICPDDMASNQLYDALGACLCGDGSAPGACSDANADPPNMSCATTMCAGMDADDACLTCVDTATGPESGACYDAFLACVNDI